MKNILVFSFLLICVICPFPERDREERRRRRKELHKEMISCILESSTISSELRNKLQEHQDEDDVRKVMFNQVSLEEGDREVIRKCRREYFSKIRTMHKDFIHERFNRNFTHREREDHEEHPEHSGHRFPDHSAHPSHSGEDREHRRYGDHPEHSAHPSHSGEDHEHRRYGDHPEHSAHPSHSGEVKIVNIVDMVIIQNIQLILHIVVKLLNILIVDIMNILVVHLLQQKHQDLILQVPPVLLKPLQ